MGYCMTTPQTLKIACPSCREHVEFPAGMRGQIINCPHCGLSMVLELPGATPRPASPPPLTPGAPLMQADSSQEIRGRDSARAVKVISGLTMCAGMFISFIPGIEAIGFLMLIVGFFGFVAGRFMD